MLKSEMHFENSQLRLDTECKTDRVIRKYGRMILWNNRMLAQWKFSYLTGEEKASTLLAL